MVEHWDSSRSGGGLNLIFDSGNSVGIICASLFSGLFDAERRQAIAEEPGPVFEHVDAGAANEHVVITADLHEFFYAAAYDFGFVFLRRFSDPDPGLVLLLEFIADIFGNNTLDILPGIHHTRTTVFFFRGFLFRFNDALFVFTDKEVVGDHSALVDVDDNRLIWMRRQAFV